MMKKIFLYTIISLFALVSCHDDDHPEPPIPTEKSRTVIFYMVADNNLSEASEENIEGLLKGTTKKNLNGGNLIIYVDKKEESPQLLKIKIKDGKAVKEIIKTYKEQNSADATVMKRVLTDVTRDYPSKHYGLVLWSHSSAWIPKGVKKMIRTRSFADDNGSEMEINTLKEVLKGGVHYDFILFDACYMGSVEVAYELRKVTDYMIGSPMEVISKGYPYDEIVGDFFSMPAGLESMSKKFYNYYDKQVRNYRTASVAVVDTKKLEKLAATVQGIMNIHRLELASVDLSKIQALEYLYDKRLLYDFDDYMKSFSDPNEYASFQKSLQEAIVYTAHTPSSYFPKEGRSIPINNCCGLTIYPLGFNPELDKWYSQLEWYKDVYQ